MEAGYDQGHARDVVPTAADAPEPAARQHLGWMISESGPAGAQHAILMIPGGLCPASFYEDVIEELRRRDANLRFVATTIPGHAGTPPPDDMGQDTYARSAGQLAKDLGCDVVVGHSMGANVAIEMAASGVYSGRVVLLSPAFSHGDEASFLWVLDRIGRIPALGGLAWKAMTAMIPSGMKGSL